MEVVEETWYKNIEDPDTFYTKVTALKLLDHLTEFCAGLHCWSFEYLYPIPEEYRNWVPRSTSCPGSPITSQQTIMCLWIAHFFFRI